MKIWKVVHSSDLITISNQNAWFHNQCSSHVPEAKRPWCPGAMFVYNSEKLTTPVLPSTAANRLFTSGTLSLFTKINRGKRLKFAP